VQADDRRTWIAVGGTEDVAVELDAVAQRYPHVAIDLPLVVGP
jgi:hypothetical protein